MARQRAAARKHWVGSGATATDTVWYELRETVGATRRTAPTRPLSTPAVYSSMETKTTRFCSSLTPSGVST